jgi:hypothetical protein
MRVGLGLGSFSKDVEVELEEENRWVGGLGFEVCDSG